MKWTIQQFKSRYHCHRWNLHQGLSTNRKRSRRIVYLLAISKRTKHPPRSPRSKTMPNQMECHQQRWRNKSLKISSISTRERRADPCSTLIKRQFLNAISTGLSVLFGERRHPVSVRSSLSYLMSIYMPEMITRVKLYRGVHLRR